MKLTIKFIVFIVVIHVVAIGLSYVVFSENKLIFIISEVFILISLYFSWHLYEQLIQPLQLMMRGIDAIRDQDFNVKLNPTGSPEPDALIEVYNAMMDKLRMERTTQQEQHFFLEKLIQTSPTGILIFDYDGKIINANPRILSILGLKEKELLGKFPHEIDNSILKSIEPNNSKFLIPNSSLLNTEGGKKFKIQRAQFIDRGFPRSFVMIEELTAEILEAEKKAYGKVIRMMAHEVNNSIGAVNSILDTTQALEQNPEIAHALNIAIERNDHLNHFMRRFADVIRLPEPRREVIDFNQLLKNSTDLMAFKAKEKQIEWIFDLSPTPLSISADVAQMEQVLINIFKNSIESVDNKGFVKITTLNEPKMLLIEDSGKGISPDILQQLFSPFFTTKKDGQGVGLTLIREILTAHGYDFNLINRQEGGAVFKIWF